MPLGVTWKRFILKLPYALIVIPGYYILYPFYRVAYRFARWFEVWDFETFDW